RSAEYTVGARNLRLVAAYAYQAFLGLAAARLGVSANSLSVSDGVVTAGTGVDAKKISYADLLRGQQLELTIPVTGALASVGEKKTEIANRGGILVTGNPPLKPASEFTVIGKSFPAPHVAEKVTAKTVWAGSFRLPEMLHARMVRPATLGSTLVSAGAIDKQR